MRNLPASFLASLSITCLAPGCDDGGLTFKACTNNAECDPGMICVAQACIAVDAMPPPPLPDLARGDMAMPDFAMDMPPPPLPIDLAIDAGCGPGMKPCGPRCIGENLCCVNDDCAVIGQTCQNDGTCACAQGQKTCGQTCIPQANCCSDAD